MALRARRRLLLALALLGAVALASCGGAHTRAHVALHLAVPAPPSPPPSGPRRGVGLAVGLSEFNGSLLWRPATGAPVPPAFDAARARLQALHPDFVGVYVDWSHLQPSPASPPDLTAAADGCDRGLPPCAPYAGLRDELAAIADDQRATGGFVPVIVIYGVPAWAAAPPHGCERPRAAPRARPLAAAALPAYRALIADVLALGRQVGLALPWWSPWNEPNHPYFISPQHASCDPAAPALAPAVYTTLARAMRAQLAADPAPHRLLLGELAGYDRSGRNTTSVADFVGALPDDLICAAGAWALHNYHLGSDAGLAQLERALDARGQCGSRAHVWITETGAAAPDARRGPGALRACAQLASALARWNADRRVDAAFQFSFREDPDFRVGLMDPALSRVYPAYAVWRAWGARRAQDPAPAPRC